MEKKIVINDTFFGNIDESHSVETDYLKVLEESTDLNADDSVRMDYLTVLNNYTDLKEMYKKNLKVVLQKIGSSNKTKVIHKLIINDKCQIGYGAIDFKAFKQVPGVVHMSGNKLQNIVIDLDFINDELTRSDLNRKIKKLVEQLAAKDKNLSTIDELSQFRLDKLELEIKITIKEILNSVDYMKAIDTYFFLFINKLVRLSYKGKGKEKIFLLSKDIFDIIIERALLGLNISEERFDEVRIAVDYIFMKVYLNTSDSNIMSNLGKTHGADKIKEFFEPVAHTRIRHSDYKEIYDLATLLTTKEIINMPPNVLKQKIKQVAGDGVENIFTQNFETFVSYLISVLYDNTLFLSPTIDKERQLRLEKLVLNFKANIAY